MKYARIQNNTVLEILELVQGFTVEQCFHPSIIAMCEMVDDSVQPSWVREEGGDFVAPTLPVVTVTTETTPVVEETVVTTETTPSTDAPVTPVIEETPAVGIT